MSDRTPPKSKKPAKDKEAKKAAGPKLVATAITPAIGHNGPPTGEKNPEAIKCLDELMEYQVQKKAIAKAERDVRNRLKSEFGILASSVAREVALRKLDADVRVQVETNHEDFKKMLGYQPSLDFVGGKPTDASAKAQPTEAELERTTAPARGPKPPATDGKGFTVEKDEGEEEEGEDGDQAQQSNVITREG